MENKSILAANAERIRQELVNIVKFYAKNPLLGNIESWSFVRLINLMMDSAVCGLSLSDGCEIVRKSLPPSVCQPEISGMNKELQMVYALCYSILHRTMQDKLISPADIIFEQTQKYLEDCGERILIVVHVEKEMFFEAWYECSDQDFYDAVYWNKEQLFFMRTVKSLNDLDDELGRECYEQSAKFVLAAGGKIPALIIVLAGISEIFQEEITNSGK